MSANCIPKAVGAEVFHNEGVTSHTKPLSRKAYTLILSYRTDIRHC